MDKQIIVQKLDSLGRCLKRIESKLPFDNQRLIDDLDLQDVVVLNLTRSVQLCVDIGAHILADVGDASPSTMGATFSALAERGIISTATSVRMIKAVGFRNIAVHDYEEIDWQIVYAICKNHLQDFRDLGRDVTQFCGL